MSAAILEALTQDWEQCYYVEENKYGNNAAFTDWIMVVILETGTKRSAEQGRRGL